LIEIKKVQVVPYLSVPVENEGIVREVVRVFKENGLIRGSRFQVADRLIILMLKY